MDRHKTNKVEDADVDEDNWSEVRPKRKRENKPSTSWFMLPQQAASTPVKPDPAKTSQ